MQGVRWIRVWGGLAATLLLMGIRPADRVASAGSLLPTNGSDLLRLAAPRQLTPPRSWRSVYREVAQCASMQGDYDAIQWGEMEGPLRGPTGTTYAFTTGSLIVLIQGDTTYLRHEMLHHVLTVAGWHPRRLAPGEHYTIADLHPMPPFGLCSGGR